MFSRLITVRVVLRIGSLNKLRRQRQRARRWTKGPVGITIALHERYKSLYISLLFSAKQQLHEARSQNPRIPVFIVIKVSGMVCGRVGGYEDENHEDWCSVSFADAVEEPRIFNYFIHNAHLTDLLASTNYITIIPSVRVVREVINNQQARSASW